MKPWHTISRIFLLLLLLVPFWKNKTVIKQDAVKSIQTGRDLVQSLVDNDEAGIIIRFSTTFRVSPRPNAHYKTGFRSNRTNPTTRPTSWSFQPNHYFLSFFQTNVIDRYFCRLLPWSKAFLSSKERWRPMMMLQSMLRKPKASDQSVMADHA